MSSGWNIFPIEHPNVDMTRFTNYVDPKTGTVATRYAPELNVEKAFDELKKLQNPFMTFAPVRASQGHGRYSLC